jgi:transcriptional regulator with XRE-family HTH domain
MDHGTPQTVGLGADLRSLRKARGLTLTALAERMDRSVGWMSQIERNLSDPSLADLRRLAQLLDVPVSMLIAPDPVREGEAGYVVRAGAHRPIGREIDGLNEVLLSPDLTDDFEMVRSVFAPGSGLSEPVQRDTQEVAVMLSGRLELRIGGRIFTVGVGDSFRIRGEAFEWRNPDDQPAEAVWVIAPPVY